MKKNSRKVTRRKTTEKADFSWVKQYIPLIVILAFVFIELSEVDISFTSDLFLTVVVLSIAFSASLIFAIIKGLDRRISSKVRLPLILLHSFLALMFLTQIVITYVTMMNNTRLVNLEQNNDVCKNTELVKDCVDLKTDYAFCSYLVEENRTFSIPCSQDALSDEQYKK